jgi:hypothetical protein
VFEALNCVDNFFLGRSATFPPFNSGVFVWFKQFVDLEKVADFIEEMFGQMINIDILAKSRIT